MLAAVTEIRNIMHTDFRASHSEVIQTTRKEPKVVHNNVDFYNHSVLVREECFPVKQKSLCPN